MRIQEANCVGSVFKQCIYYTFSGQKQLELWDKIFIIADAVVNTVVDTANKLKGYDPVPVPRG